MREARFPARLSLVQIEEIGTTIRCRITLRQGGDDGSVDRRGHEHANPWPTAPYCQALRAEKTADLDEPHMVQRYAAVSRDLDLEAFLSHVIDNRLNGALAFSLQPDRCPHIMSL
ncbi:hypothetical protein QPK87_24245 [Kamptonema cortianum]|nr:hypothetical protein [Kamptonema cortianum]